MADDVFDDFSSKAKSATKAAKEGTKALDELRKSQETPVDAKNPDVDYIKNYADFAEDAANAQKKWSTEIKDSVKALAEQAKQVGSLRSQFKDATGALQGFMGQLKNAASITHQYSLAMREFRQGSEAYTASLELSTKAVEKHGSQAQKYMTAIQKSYNSAYDVAAKYGMEVEKVRAVSDNLQKTFSSQLGVMGNQAKSLDKLRDQTIAFARITGTDASEAVQTLNERLRMTGMTLDEVRQEQLIVAKSIDDYKNKLHEMGEEARKTGNITSKDFLDVLKKVRAEFRQGIFDAASFSKSITHIAIAGKKAGLTTEEAQATAAGFGQILSQAGKFSNFFGARSAQVMEGMMGDLSQISDQTLKKRLEFINRRAAETNMAPVQKLDMIADAMRGSAEGQHILMKQFRTFLPPELMREQFKTLGNLSALQAEVLTETVTSGKAEKEALDLAKKSPEEREKEAEKFASPLEKLAAQGARAESARHETAKKTFEFQQKITQFVEKYWYMFAIAQAGASMAGGLLKKAGGALLKKFAPGLASRLGMGAVPGAAGAAAPAAGGAVPGAAAAGGKLVGAMKAGGAMFAAYASFKGLEQAYGHLMKGQYKEAALKAATAPFWGGYQMGTSINKYVGKGVALTQSSGVQQQLGSDTTLSNIMATRALNTGAGSKIASWIGGGNMAKHQNMMMNETTNMQWDEYQALKKKYRFTIDEIKALEAKKRRGEKLYDYEETTLKLRKMERDLMEKNNRNLKRHVEYESKENIAKRMKESQKGDIMSALGGVDMSQIKSKEDLQVAMAGMVRSSGRLWRYGGAGDAFQSLMADPEKKKQLSQMAKQAGVSEEEMLKMFTGESERYAASQKARGANLNYDLKTPTSVPQEATDQMRQAAREGGPSVNIVAEGGEGNEFVREMPDGGIEKTTYAVVKLKTKVNGNERAKTALNDALQVKKAQGDKQAR